MPLIEGRGGRGATDLQTPLGNAAGQSFGKVIYFITNVIGAVAFSQGFQNGRVGAERRHQFDDQIAGYVPAQKADRDLLNRVVYRIS